VKGLHVVKPIWQRRALLTGLVIAGVLVLGAIAALLTDQFGPIDPTDPGWKARVTNDTGQAIHVKSSASDIRIETGSQDIVVSPGPGQLHVVYRITDEKGTVLGCLAVDLNKRETVNVSASAMRSCTE
jgi:hypothetical protein